MAAYAADAARELETSTTIIPTLPHHRASRPTRCSADYGNRAQTWSTRFAGFARYPLLARSQADDQVDLPRSAHLPDESSGFCGSIASCGRPSRSTTSIRIRSIHAMIPISATETLIREIALSTPRPP